MTILEDAVKELADALDRLETKLNVKMNDATSDQDAVAAAQRQAHSAKHHLTEASAGLSASLRELRALLEMAAQDDGDDADLTEDDQQPRAQGGDHGAS